MLSMMTLPPPPERGSFAGVPTHFKGWCATAARGGEKGGYRWVGRMFGDGLLSYTPWDLEDDDWTSVVVANLEPLLNRHDVVGIAAWLRRHFPRMVTLVPRKRFHSFVEGFLEAYDDGEMMDDVPAGFEPHEVDLDDPCAGSLYVEVSFVRPTRGLAYYQCTAPRCREASRAFVEAFAAEHSLLLVDVGEYVAAVGFFD